MQKDGLATASLPFSDPITHFRNGDVNTGDLLVFDSILKQLTYDEVRNVQIKEGLGKIQDEYKFDVTVVRGSNYITESIDLGYMVDVLKKINTPIIPLGIGAQAPSYKKMSLHKGTVEALHVMADKCETIGVRGNYSAEVLNDLGIKNISVIGCPSFYRSTSPRVEIKKPTDTRNIAVGFTLNKYLWGEYASNWIKALRIQRSLFLECIARGNSFLYSQGEREETLSTLVDGEEKQQQIAKIQVQFDLPHSDAVQQFLSSRVYSPFTIDDWSEHVGKNVDFMIGFRLHGNVIALHQGIPSAYFTYDTRIRELTALFGLPTIEVDTFRPVDLNYIIEHSDFSKFERCYEQNYKNYSAFLTKNGLNHRLASDNSVSAPTAPSDVENGISVPYDNSDRSTWIATETEHLTRWIMDLDNARRHLLQEASHQAQAQRPTSLTLRSAARKLSRLFGLTTQK